jgi:hypothetical protein
MFSQARTLLLSFALAPLVTGCASIPRSHMPESEFTALDCAGIADQLGQAQVTKKDAAEAKRRSWKAVLPIAVGARFVRASHLMKEADHRESTLLREQEEKSCARVSG